MEDPNKQQTQTRFIMAAVLSLIVLTGWTYFFAPKPTDNPANTNTAAANANANTGGNSNVGNTETAETEKVEPETEVEAPIPDDVAAKSITIKSPLYEVVLDNKGAAASSWILLINDSPDKNERKPIYADGADLSKKAPLQLISAKGLEEKPSMAPFKLKTGDKSIDKTVNTRNYSISVDEKEVSLKSGETKEIVFSMTGEGGIEVVKKFVFRADSYIADVAVTLKKDGNTVPDTKMVIGPSIGDQGVPRYTFYKVAPEGVYNTSVDQNRQYAASILGEDGKPGEMKIDGDVDWAGVGDTYFAMTLVPAKPAAGLELHSSMYEEKTEPFTDGIVAFFTRAMTTSTTKHLMTAYVPIAADGSVNRLYTGTKDYFVLNKYNTELTSLAGRTVDIENIINYGWLSFLTKPLSTPILHALQFLYGLTFNYGIAVIIFTFFFYSLLFPLRWYSSKSFKKAQKNAPKMTALRDKIKKMQDKGIPADDPRMRDLQMEQLKMTKDALPIGGCLPTLLQFPLIITLYYTVSISLGFRHEQFLWLNDLSAGDPIKILPIAFAVSMVLSMKFTPATPSVTPEQQMQQKMMTYMMPVMMLLFMWSAPAGLLIYWFTGNIIMFGQQMLINWINKEPEAEIPIETTKLKKKKA
jgi:YidC/Oxa1 family membrane protein insertase